MVMPLFKATTSLFSVPRAYSTKVTTHIPGLHVYQNFLETRQAIDLQQKAVSLHKSILCQIPLSNSQKCRTSLSKYHNLRSEERFQKLEIIDVKNEKIHGQHFERYGEPGHKLTYFIRNCNIPKFCKNRLISRIIQCPEVEAIIQGRPIEWNFTFNTYATLKNKTSILPGFDFHKDIESNGEATVIYSIGAPSIFQIRHPDKPVDICEISLLDNTFIVLSNEARWDYEHRVLPITVSNDFTLFEDDVESIRRISLVLGFIERLDA